MPTKNNQKKLSMLKSAKLKSGRQVMVEASNLRVTEYDGVIPGVLSVLYLGNLYSKLTKRRSM